MTILAELRWYDPNCRPPGMTSRYCPACSCRKNGYVQEPNHVDEGCMDEQCCCHDEDAWAREVRSANIRARVGEDPEGL
jgi:hypothetical protein